MTRPRHLHLAATLGLGLAACDESRPTEARLGDEAVVVLEGPRVERIDPVTPLPLLGVQDVVRVAGRWVATLRLEWIGGAPSPDPYATPLGCSECTRRYDTVGDALAFPLVTSADGATWQPLVPRGGWYGDFVLGVQPDEDGELAWLVGEVGLLRPTNQVYEAWRVQRLDLTMGDILVGPALGVELPGQPRPHGAMLSGVSPLEAPGDSLRAFVLDLDGVSSWSARASGWEGNQVGGADNGWLTDDGFTFTNYFLTRAGERCWARVLLDGPLGLHTPFTACTQASTWPIPVDVPVRMHRFTRGLMAVGEGSGHVWAVEIVPDDPPALVVQDLGAGRLSHGASPSLHPRYGAFVRLDGEGDDDRFVDIGRDGVVAAFTFPASPCEPERACAARLEWLEPMGDGRHMAFWIAQPDTRADLHQLVVAAPVEGAPTEP